MSLDAKSYLTFDQHLQLKLNRAEQNSCTHVTNECPNRQWHTGHILLVWVHFSHRKFKSIIGLIVLGKSGAYTEFFGLNFYLECTSQSKLFSTAQLLFPSSLSQTVYSLLVCLKSFLFSTNVRAEGLKGKQWSRRYRRVDWKSKESIQWSYAINASGRANVIRSLPSQRSV